MGGRSSSKGRKGAGSNELKRSDSPENTHEEGFVYADQSMLDILKLPMVYGDATHALTEPLTMVISKSKADNISLVKTRLAR